MAKKFVDREIYSAYRFVPVNKLQGYFGVGKNLSEVLSFDKPIENGLSGKITFSIEAKTPLFIKGADGEFCRKGDEYFIPATSIKGCIRSVLEIMSFGHLKKRYENKEFVIRDLADKANYMSLMKNIYCGWLSKDGTKLSNCGKPSKIKYYHIDKNFADVSAIEKYSKYKSLRRSFRFELKDITNRDGKVIGKQEWAMPGGNQIGYIFFSGKMDNKKSDFVLKKNKATDTFPVGRKPFLYFQEIYPDYKNLPFDEEMGGYPVFFSIVDGEVYSIGLSYLHKFAAINQVKDAIPQEMVGDDYDLADLIFGSNDCDCRGRVQFSYGKQIGDIKLLKEGNESILTVLGSPQASFYPTYLQGRQTWNSKEDVCVSGFKRYPIKKEFCVSKLFDLSNKKDLPSNRNEIIEKFGDKNFNEFCYSRNPYLWEGWDRNREDCKLIPREENNIINVDSLVELNPINIGSKFSFEVKFYNLRDFELGALLSAISFHKQEDNCKHNLGMAKAYGYGAIQISDIKLFNYENCEFTLCEWRSYCDIFATLMDSQMHRILSKNIKWDETAQIKELFSLAKGIEKQCDIFTPMLLKEFAKAKEQYLKGNTKFSKSIELKR